MRRPAPAGNASTACSGHSTNAIVSSPKKGSSRPGILASHPGEPIEVEVREGTVSPVVQVTDHESGRRDRTVYAEAAQRAAHERRLPRAELARDEHDVAGLQAGGELRAGGFGGLGSASAQSAHGGARGA